MSAPLDTSQSDSRLVRLSPFRDKLDPLDLPALRDLVRFSLMTADQLLRRYADAAFGLARLDALQQARFIEQWREHLEGSRIYEPTGRARHIARVIGAQRRRVNQNHLLHDIGLVDLADLLTGERPDRRFLAESEVRAYLDQIAPPPRRMPGDKRHRPDGLLVDAEGRSAIELELHAKDTSRYAQISAWFVREWRVDRVRWYIDGPRIRERLFEVNAQHGFDRDMRIELLPLPPDMRIRTRQGRFAR